MLSKTELIAKIIEIVNENLLIDGSDVDISENSNLMDELQLDSMELVSLCIEIEESYGVVLEPEDFSAIDITPTAIADLVISKSKDKQSEVLA